jgi:hypothetical protein
MEERISMPISLDSDRFLRRACSACDREFKVLYTDDETEATEPHELGYFCPYCEVQAPGEAWSTEAQLEYAKAVALGWAADQFTSELSKLNRRGSGITFEPSKQASTPPEPPIEPDDMLRVDFECHPNDSLKVLESWDKPVHCHICGETN